MNKENDKMLAQKPPPSKIRLYPNGPYIHQPTPHDISRYVIFIVYLMSLACSCTYYSWFSFTEYLLLGNKFQWLCSLDEIRSNAKSSFKCKKQEHAIHLSLNLIRGIDNSISLLASLLSDRYRPNVVVICGVVFAIIGWVVMSVANTSASMYFSMTFIGMASSMLYCPMLNISNLFLDCSSLAISALMYIGESISQSTTFIMKYVILSTGYGNIGFFTATNLYVGFFLVVCLFGTIICVPSRPFKDQVELLGGYEDERTRIVTNQGRRSLLQIFFKRDTTNQRLLYSMFGAKMHMSVVYLSIVSVVKEFFTTYMYEKYHKLDRIMLLCTCLTLITPCVNIPIGIIHDMGYSQWVLIIYHIAAFGMCLVLKWFPDNFNLCLFASLFIVIFMNLQENGIILYIENNYRTNYLSTLVSFLYTCSGIFELICLFFEHVFHVERCTLDLVIVLMAVSIISLAALAYLHKCTKFTDYVISDEEI